MTQRLQVETTNKQILKIALPICLALMVPQLNFVINNVFLGHLSEQALATASITGVYYLVFAQIGNGLNNGVQTLISRRAGENRPEEIGRVFNQAILLSVLISIVGIVLTYTVTPYILQKSIHSKETYQMSVHFLKIRIWGLPLLYIYQMRNALLVGTNQSKYLVFGTATEAVCNAFFDYGFIFGHFGLPKLGFDGAAYASIIAELAGLFVIFALIHAKGIGKRFLLFQNIQWNKEQARLILNISGPIIFQYALSIISWVYFFILVEHHGPTSLAVSNTMRNVFGFFGVYLWAFASTTNSMVSNVIGQGRKDEVLPVIRKIVKLNAGITVVVAILLNLFPNLYLSIYGQDRAFMQLAIPVLRLLTFVMLFMSIATVWLNAVIATGNSSKAFFIEVITLVLYCLYVYLTLEVYFLPIIWGWGSELLYWLSMFTLSYFYMKSGKWKTKTI
jgi:putative MATE family efflux protein